MKTISESIAAPLTPDERLGVVPFKPSRSSFGLGWSGVRAEHFQNQPSSDVEQPPLTDHFLILQGSAPLTFGRFECDGVVLDKPPVEGSVTVIPAGAGSRFQWEVEPESTHFQLNRAAFARAAAETCDLDPATVSFRPVLFGHPHPSIVATLTALRDELFTGGVGSRLCAETLANILVVHLIRHLAGGPTIRGMTGRLARHVVKAVDEYVMENLDASIGLADLAAVAHLSEFHFARLFKATTGQTPHQFVIGRRVERAKQLLLERRLTLVQVAVACGFTDQSGFAKHFKRVVGVTPKRFG